MTRKKPSPTRAAQLHVVIKRYAQPTLITLSIVAVFLGFFGLGQLYQNSKTDGFNSGSITIEDCQEVDWAWKIYSCRGTYQASAGTLSSDNVSVRVTGNEYEKGDAVSDVYPRGFSSKGDATHFVTGKERSSVLYNAPWLALFGLGIFLPIVTATYILTRRAARP